MIDLLLSNIKVLLGGSPVEADLGIDGGRISCVCKEPSAPRASSVIDGRGMLAIPGGIDPHVHVYDPEYSYREDYGSGSRSAIMGGVTMIIDMPLVAYVDSPEAARKRMEEGLRNSLVDFSIHAGFLRGSNIAEMQGLCSMGICSFKAFLAPPYEIEEPALARAFREAAKLRGLLLFHAEDAGMLLELSEELRSRDDAVAPHEARPPEAEGAAIARVGYYARYYGASAHIVHLSGAEGLDEVLRFKRAGVDMSAETCPQYLVFTRDDVRRLGNRVKMAPSLKSAGDRDSLWRALQDGWIDMVATDHAPGTEEEKGRGAWDAWGGVPGVATMIPLLYTMGVLGGRISLSRFAEVTSSAAARRFGLRGKGALAPGYDADIALLNTSVARKVDGRALYRVGWSPYDGMELKGWPELVLQRGDVLMEGGEGGIVAKGGRAAFIPTRPSPIDI